MEVRTRRPRTMLLMALLVVCFALAPSLASPPLEAASSSPMDTAQGEYPRVIRLAHNTGNPPTLIATFTQRGPNGATNPVYRSSDDGASWQRIATVATGLRSDNYSCCSTLFELPQQLGSFAAGTLLLAVRADISAGSGTIDIYRSANQGQSWVFHSTAATGSLWEPEFTVDSAGRLLVFFADERQPGYSQVIAHLASSDGGLSWGSYTIDLGVQDNNQRPGMPVVRRLPNNSYVMIYEWCGSMGLCRVYTRSSSDGASWGAPNNVGSLVQAASGEYFECCPGITWMPGGGPNGQLVAIGRLIRNGSGNGQTVMTTTDLSGASGWQKAPSPFVTPNPDSDAQAWHCENYSSALLPSADGQRLLMLAGKVVSGSCQIHYATDSIAAPSNPWTALNDSVVGNGVNQFDYSAGWGYGTSCGDCFANDDHYSVTAGATVTIRFSGTQLRLYGATAPWHGIGAISVDGGPETSVDYYSPSRQGRQLIYTTPQLPAGQHELRLRVTGSRNPSATDNWITVDQAEVTASGGTTLFSSGFESGEPQPTWTNSVDSQGGGGASNVGGICCGLSGPELGVRTGERSQSGGASLLYSGNDSNGAVSYAYMRAFDVNIPVGSTTTLSYWIYPQSSSETGLVSGSNSSCVAVDLVATDGSVLRNTNARDQHGTLIHPANQCGTLTLNSWNLREVQIGGTFNGKTIDRILVAYDQGGNTGGFRGYIDTVRIFNP